MEIAFVLIENKLYLKKEVEKKKLYIHCFFIKKMGKSLIKLI